MLAGGAAGLVCWRSTSFTIIGMGLHKGMIRGSTVTADIDCIVGGCARWGLLFGSQVCYQWLEYPEKLELWIIPTHQTEDLMNHVDDIVIVGRGQMHH